VDSVKGPGEDPLAVLTSVSTSLGVIDKVSGQIDRFVKKQPDPPVERPHSVIAQQTGDTIRFMKSGVPEERITAAEMDQLDPQSRQLITAIEQSMTQQFDRWTLLYPKRNSTDLLENAQVNTELDQLAKGMCEDLGKLLSFLEKMGKYLEDHYLTVRFICNEL
jgi:hypothetical protein